MLPEQFQCQYQMFFVFFLILRVNKNVIKENKNKIVQILLKILFIRHINVVGAFVRPNGTTTNS